MEVSSSHQLYVFFLCVGAGIGCGMFFDLQRSLRKLHFAGGLRTMVEDFVFVLVTLTAVISLGFFFNSGQMRYYQIMGSISGVLFYAAFLSRGVMKGLEILYGIIGKILVKPIGKIFKRVILVMKKIWRFIKKVFSKIKKYIKRLHKSMSKRRKVLKKRIKML